MLPIVSTLNLYLAIGTIALQLGIILVFVSYIFKSLPYADEIVAVVKQFAFPLAFLTALFGTVLTLVYSDIFGFIPCGLCWFERIFLYPQVILIAIATWKKDSQIWKYIIALSLFGFVIALYHHYIQIGGADLIPCPASGNGDCGQRIIYEFDYITFPLMAATLFLWHALLGLIASKKN